MEPAVAAATTAPRPLTTPLATAEPTAADAALAESLRSFLGPLSDSEDDRAKRAVIVGRLEQHVRAWTKELVRTKRLPDVPSSQCRLVTFGSCFLDVHDAHSDIDSLCIGPHGADREEFFSDLFERLQGDADATDVQRISDAYVPIVKLSYMGIHVDVLYTQMGQAVAPCDMTDEVIAAEETLRGMDEKSVLALNGRRVATEILKLVENAAVFRDALRCVKLWAKSRAVYGNSLGFPGGVAWAILVARVCQLMPKANASRVVLQFFRIFSMWKWPAPVLLCPLRSGSLGLKVWNAEQDYRDRQHLMPIITPVYPSMNCTFNVSETTKRILQAELVEADRICHNIEAGKRTWSRLFKPLEIFKDRRYRYYLRIRVQSGDRRAYVNWFGWCESKLRRLVLELEQVKGVEVRPYPHCFSYQDPRAAARAQAEQARPGSPPYLEFWSCYYLAIAFAAQAGGPAEVDLGPHVKEFDRYLRDWPHFAAANMDVDFQIFRSQEMPTELASHVAAGSVDAASTSRGIINAAAPTEAAAPPTEAAAPEAQAAAEQGTEAAEAPAEDAPAEDVPDAAAEAKPMSWAQRAAGPKQ